jgi:drug/metabolite transporter (DMT)-like permease
MDRALARVTSVLCIPYGYTVTLCCAGAWTAARQGLPSRADVLLFASGAVVAFLLLATLGRRRLDREVPMRLPAVAVLNAWPIVIVAVVLGVPQAGVSRSLAFLGSSFLATAIYIVAVATWIRLAERRSRPIEPGATPVAPGRRGR